MFSRAAAGSIRANALHINGKIGISRTAVRCPNAIHRLMLPTRLIVRHKFNQANPKLSGMDKLRQAYREHPILLPFGFISVVASFLFLGFANYVYFVGIKAFHNFPEPVAKELRKAIYYDKGYGQDPKKAFQHYKEAIMVATDLQMAPLSDEFMGMRIRAAEFLEEHGQYETAIAFLEKEKGYCYKFMEKANEKVEKVAEEDWSRIVGIAVRLGIKLGKLYSDDTVDKPKEAQQTFVLAVETLLRENIRREQEGLTADARWLKNEEVGASLEELGHSYLNTLEPELALPLFLQALSLCPPKSCHAAMLMNEISAALSMQEPGTAPLLETSEKQVGSATLTAQDLQNQAKQWAEKALATAEIIAPPDRTDECDIACAVTTHNLAELASISGNIAKAKRLFQEARSLSKAIDFEDGVKEATIALERLQTSTRV